MRKQKRKPNQTPVYGLDRLPVRFIRGTLTTLVFLAVIFSSHIALVFLIPLNQRTLMPCLLCTSPFIIYFAFFLWANLADSLCKHLTLKEEGIHMQLMGVKSFASWDDLAQFGWKSWGKKQHWGIVIDRSTAQSQNVFSRLFPYNKPITQSKNLFSRLFYYSDVFDHFIPLERFAPIPRSSDKQIDLERFKKTPLGSDLYYYAPHLFDKWDTDKPKH